MTRATIHTSSGLHFRNSFIRRLLFKYLLDADAILGEVVHQCVKRPKSLLLRKSHSHRHGMGRQRVNIIEKEMLRRS